MIFLKKISIGQKQLRRGGCRRRVDSRSETFPLLSRRLRITDLHIGVSKAKEECVPLYILITNGPVPSPTTFTLFYLRAARLLEEKGKNICFHVSTLTVIIQDPSFFLLLLFFFFFVFFFFFCSSLPFSGTLTLSDEPQPMNRSHGVRRRHRPADVARRCQPPSAVLTKTRIYTY